MLFRSHTDYILAIIGEELGFLGVGFVIAMYVLLVLRGCTIAARARDAFGMYISVGVTAMFGLQAAFNIGVVLGALPTKGLTLPFRSFGGSTLVIDLCAIGMLLNISRCEPAPVEKRSKKGSWKRFWPVRRNRRRVADRLSGARA